MQSDRLGDQSPRPPGIFEEKEGFVRHERVVGNLWGKPPVKAPASTALAVADWRHDVMVRPFDLADSESL